MCSRMFLTNHWTPPIPSPPMIMLALRKPKLSQTRNIANISIFSLRRTRLVMIKSHTGVKTVQCTLPLFFKIISIFLEAQVITEKMFFTFWCRLLLYLIKTLRIAITSCFKFYNSTLKCWIIKSSRSVTSHCMLRDDNHPTSASFIRYRSCDR